MRIATILQESAGRFPDRPALTAGGASWTYADLADRAARLASGFLGLGLAPGDRLALLTRTLFSAVHGVLVLGLDEKLIAVPVAALEQQIDMLVRLVCAGLGSEESR